MRVDLAQAAQASKFIGWLATTGAALAIITAVFVTGTTFTEYQIEQSLKRIDDYEKLRYYYDDKEIEQEELSSFDQRRQNIVNQVLEKEYRDLENFEDRLETLETLSPF